MKLYSVVIAVLFLHAQFPHSSCENILFYFGVAGPSHISTAFTMVEALADKGHNVTVLTPYPINRTLKPGVNITIIMSHELLAFFAPMWDKDADLVGDRVLNKQAAWTDTVLHVAAVACEIVLSSPSTSTMIYNSQFDLVIYDTGFNECAVVLARHKYNALFIAFSGAPVIGYYHDAFGIPFEHSVIPDMESSAPSPLTFYQKIRSTINSLWWVHKRTTSYYPALEELIQIKLGLKTRPSVAELIKETSLVLVNTHHTTEYARSLPPSFIPVGGMSVTEERKPLPKDLQKFLAQPGGRDYAGFVYVSFGTVVRIAKSNSEIRTKFFNAMGNASSLKFVWKWEDQIPEEAPKNIYFSNWLPQQDLLAHKDIKGMIGHGGINGIHEAIYFGVPLIIIPIFADQDYNAHSIESKGLCIKLEITTFSQTDLGNALKEILTNERLKTNVQRASKEFRDRPMTPLNTAVWWVEYVLRHKNTSSLKPLTRNQTWYEKRLLDVWLTIFLTLATGAYTVGLLIFVLSIYLKNAICKRNQKQKKRKQSSIKPVSKSVKQKSDVSASKGPPKVPIVYLKRKKQR